MNKSKTNVMVENDTPTYVDRSRMLKSTSTLGRETAPETNKTRQGVSMKNHGRIDSIRKAPRHVQGQNWNMLERDTSTIMRSFSNDIRSRNMDTHALS